MVAIASVYHLQVTARSDFPSLTTVHCLPYSLSTSSMLTQLFHTDLIHKIQWQGVVDDWFWPVTSSRTMTQGCRWLDLTRSNYRWQDKLTSHCLNTRSGSSLNELTPIRSNTRPTSKENTFSVIRGIHVVTTDTFKTNKHQVSNMQRRRWDICACGETIKFSHTHTPPPFFFVYLLIKLFNVIIVEDTCTRILPSLHLWYYIQFYARPLIFPWSFFLEPILPGDGLGGHQTIIAYVSVW